MACWLDCFFCEVIHKKCGLHGSYSQKAHVIRKGSFIGCF